MPWLRQSLSSRLLVSSIFCLPLCTGFGCSGATAGDNGDPSLLDGSSGDGGDESGNEASDNESNADGDNETTSDETDTGSGSSDSKVGSDTGKEGGSTDCGADSDGDGISDIVEGRYAAGGPVDTDKDGTPDYLDDDSDGDGIADKLEWADPKNCSPDGQNDVDGDGIPNFQDLDSDGNGYPDKDEVCPPTTMPGAPAGCSAKSPSDFDKDGVYDFLDFDNDHDSSSSSLEVGLEDSFELRDNTGKYVGLIDSDGDKIPDLYDVDSDNDTIPDLNDGIGDIDKDGLPNFRDIDSDGDGVGDSCEKTVDTDGDGKPDFLDLDSDGDLLVDGLEDKNGDCIVDTLETDRLKKDTDGDGIDDLIETTLLGPAGAKDPTITPLKSGKFYFIVPYSADGSAMPTPGPTPLALSTVLNQGDVAFAIDSTTSMDGIESNLASSIASKIIPGLSAKIPDLYLGVIGFDDVLTAPFGGLPPGPGKPADSFIWFPNGGNPTKGSYLTSNPLDATNAAKGLNKTTLGGDYPEGSIPALWWTLTGDKMTWSGGSFPAASGVPVDRFGGLRFRKDALPIVIHATDANFHNGITTGCGGLGACAQMAYGAADGAASSLGHSPSLAELKDKFNGVGAKYIGITVHGGGTGKSTGINRDATTLNRYGSTVDELYLARNTKSKVPPAVLGGTALDCKTSDPAATVPNPADVADGMCPLVFDIQYGGAGLGEAVVSGVVGLLNAIKFDVHVQAIPVVSGTVDPVDAFMQNVLPMPSGGTDPVTGKICVSFSGTADRFSGPKAIAGTDGAEETILGLTPGPLYCFSVAAKANTTVPPTGTAQVFHANLRVLAEKPKPPDGPGGTFTLGADREVLFIVPPVIN